MIQAPVGRNGGFTGISRGGGGGGGGGGQPSSLLYLGNGLWVA